MLCRINPILTKLTQMTANSRAMPNYVRHNSSNIVRLGVDVLPTMSQAVVHNGIVYLSGQIDGTADDIKGQTKNILKKVDQYLQEAGTDKSKLLTSTIWLKDIGKDFGSMNEVWNEWIDPINKPVRATTQASLATKKLLVEIQVTATTALK